MKIILLCILAVATIGVMVPSAFAFEDKGDFYLVYSETENYKDYENWVKELTDSYLRAFNKSYGKSQGTFGHG